MGDPMLQSNSYAFPDLHKRLEIQLYIEDCIRIFRSFRNENFQIGFFFAPLSQFSFCET